MRLTPPRRGPGLSICETIIERHGEGITARSAPGMETAFIVRLPLIRKESKRAT